MNGTPHLRSIAHTAFVLSWFLSVAFATHAMVGASTDYEAQDAGLDPTATTTPMKSGRSSRGSTTDQTAWWGAP